MKRLALIVGLGALSWVATYVGMLELIEANMGDLPLIHKAIIGFSVAMLMTMIVWLLDRIFAPAHPLTKAAYVAGYIFLSLISIGFGFGFYWKVLESRGEASRSAESAITQVQTSLYGAATRLEQLQSTLDQLTTLSSEKSEQEKATGRTCPDSRPGDGPRRKMREEDAARFKFASDFVKGRVSTVKSDMAGLDADLQKIVKDDRSVIDAKTGTRNDFLRGVGRKLDLTVTGFNAFRSDPQLRQIRSDLAERAEKTTIPGSNGSAISCPDAQLQMALRGVVRAIDQLPELEKPKIAAVEGSEATIEAFRRLTTTMFGLMSFKLPPSADELRELQKKAVQSIELQGEGRARAPVAEVSAGLAKRDYVPLSVAIFVDLCLLLVSIGRPMNRFVGMQQAIREAERWPGLSDPAALLRYPRRRNAGEDLRRVPRSDLRSQRPLPRRSASERTAPCREPGGTQARGATPRQRLLCPRRQRHSGAAAQLHAWPPRPTRIEAAGQQVHRVLRRGTAPARAALRPVEAEGRETRLQGLPLSNGRLAGDDPGRSDGGRLRGRKNARTTRSARNAGDGHCGQPTTHDEP